MNAFMIRIICCILVLLLTACSSRPPIILLPVEKQQHQQQLSDLQQWQFKGRLAYSDKKQKHSASVLWQQQQDDFLLSLHSFIGTQILALQQTADGATLDIDDEIHRAANATRLLYQLTQWHVPVNDLSNWLKGKKNPHDDVTYSSSGWISALKHRQWHVEYNQYKPVDNYLLPHEIVIKGQGRTIKLRINQWTLN